MRFWRVSIVILALLAVISAYAYAHPGRTDGSGGHTNHSTGEYHYHHGYSEHQHYDMDGDGIEDCPYKFKDNTSHNDSSSSSSADYWKDRYNSLMQEEEEKAEEKQEEEKNHIASTNDKKGKNKVTVKDVLGFIFAAFIVMPPLIVVPIAYIGGKVRDLIQKMKKK